MGIGERGWIRRPALPKRRNSTSASAKIRASEVRLSAISRTTLPARVWQRKMPAGFPAPAKASSNSGKASLTLGSIARAMSKKSQTAADGNCARIRPMLSSCDVSNAAYVQSKRRFEMNATQLAPACRHCSAAVTFSVSDKAPSNLKLATFTILTPLAGMQPLSCA